MPAHFLRGLQLFHLLIFALGAIGYLVFWARTRFWLPAYAHVLALIALVVGIWCAAGAPPDSPLGKEGPVSRLLFALVLPAIVYGFFVLYGGQQFAFNRRFRKSPRCPNCKMPVKALQVGAGVPDPIAPASRQCPHCGQFLAP
jgi:hypothetical protein